MRQFFVILFFVSLVQAVNAVITIKTKTSTGTLLISSSYLSNCVEVSPSDDLDAVYTAIKAKGPTSANRWVIRYYPGTYIRTSSYVWDTDYIDHEGIGASPDNVIVTRAGGGPAVVQTASDIRCTNFTIQNTGNADGDHGFLINAVTNNNASEYVKMKFSQPNIKPYSHYPVFTASDLGGTWRECQAGDYAWRCADGKNLTAAMYNCTAGIYSYMGDNEGNTIGTGKLSGYLVGCVGGDYSFASCSTWGSEISGTLIDCTGGVCSFAIGKPISGTLIHCTGGGNSFAGWCGNVNVAYYSSITGTLVDCRASGGNSFAMGHVSCIQSGTLIRCKNSGYEGSANGLSGAKVSTVIDASAFASVSTSYENANNDSTFTARELGKTGNNIVVYYHYKHPLPAAVTSGWSAGNVRKIDIRYRASTKASEIKSLIESNPLANSWVTVTYADGDGSGVIGSNSSVEYPLTGGVGSPTFTGCCPDRPIICTANTVVYPFDNGATFQNDETSSSITFTLPSAMKGLKYTFVDTNNAPGINLTIVPKTPASESFILANGLTDADNALMAEDNIYQSITLECFQTGKWTITNSSGVWD